MRRSSLLLALVVCLVRSPAELCAQPGRSESPRPPSSVERPPSETAPPRADSNGPRLWERGPFEPVPFETIDPPRNPNDPLRGPIEPARWQSDPANPFTGNPLPHGGSETGAPSPATKALPPRTAPSDPAAGSNGGRHKSAPTRSVSPTASLTGTVAALAIVVAILFGGTWWLRRHGPPQLRPLPADVVEPLGQRVLSRGVAVHVVRCGQRILILGVGPDGVRTLSEVHDPLEIDLITGACRRRDEGQPSVPFGSLFQRSTTPAAAATRPSSAAGLVAQGSTAAAGSRERLAPGDRGHG